MRNHDQDASCHGHVTHPIAIAAGWEHLLELPNKMRLNRADCLTVQQVYRGWALLGIAGVGALLATAGLAALQFGKGRSWYLAVGVAACIALSLIIFFPLTYPANTATQNWTVLPEGCEMLRRQWEYSHAADPVLYFTALVMLTLSAATERE